MSTLKCERNLKLSRDELMTKALSLSTKSGDLNDKLLHWDFGPMMEMKFQTDAANYLFSSEAVPFHWDGAFHKEPQLLVFYCLESEGRGGETLFTDTEKIWDSLSHDDKKLCEGVTLTYRTQKLAHYGGEIKVPLVQQHPVTKKTILRMAESVTSKLNPVDLEINGVSDPDQFYQWMISKLYDPRFLHTHSWMKGDYLVCDNFTFLHGRNPLKDNLARTFLRLQIL